jgi:hypothetical protein
VKRPKATVAGALTASSLWSERQQHRDRRHAVELTRRCPHRAPGSARRLSASRIEARDPSHVRSRGICACCGAESSSRGSHGTSAHPASSEIFIDSATSCPQQRERSTRKLSTPGLAMELRKILAVGCHPPFPSLHRVHPKMWPRNLPVRDGASLRTCHRGGSSGSTRRRRTESALPRPRIRGATGRKPQLSTSTRRGRSPTAGRATTSCRFAPQSRHMARERWV